MDLRASDIIERLKLQPHPEGGYFREVYRSGETVEAAALPPRFAGPRRFSTSIYFLLTGDTFSALHRIASDELWHFYAGHPLDVESIHADGSRATLRLGSHLERDEVFQGVVPACCWFGAALAGPCRASDYSLVGCTVAPGFDFADFEMGRRGELLETFPQHAELIRRLTRV